MRYNFFTWWLSVSCKPRVYRVWRYLLLSVMFLAWVIFLAVYREYYWQFSLYACVPLFAIDFTWDMIQFYCYRKKVKEGKIDEWADKKTAPEWDGIVFGKDADSDKSRR